MESYVTSDTLSAKTQLWLNKIQQFNSHEMPLNPQKSALFVIDMQRFFVDSTSSSYLESGAAVLPNVQQLISAFRKANRPVIYTRHVHHPNDLDSGIMDWWWRGKCIEGSPESEIHPDLTPLPKEKVVFKHRYSAFYNTDLETVLRCLKIEDIVITGVMTNMCCESTTRDAYYRDFRIFFLADGTGTLNEEMHVASLLNIAYGFAFVTTCDSIITQVR